MTPKQALLVVAVTVITGFVLSYAKKQQWLPAWLDV